MSTLHAILQVTLIAILTAAATARPDPFNATEEELRTVLRELAEDPRGLSMGSQATIVNLHYRNVQANRQGKVFESLLLSQAGSVEEFEARLRPVSDRWNTLWTQRGYARAAERATARVMTDTAGIVGGAGMPVASLLATDSAKDLIGGLLDGYDTLRKDAIDGGLAHVMTPDITRSALQSFVQQALPSPDDPEFEAELEKAVQLLRRELIDSEAFEAMSPRDQREFLGMVQDRLVERVDELDEVVEDVRSQTAANSEQISQAFRNIDGVRQELRAFKEKTGEAIVKIGEGLERLQTQQERTMNAVHTNRRFIAANRQAITENGRRIAQNTTYIRQLAGSMYADLSAGQRIEWLTSGLYVPADGDVQSEINRQEMLETTEAISEYLGYADGAFAIAAELGVDPELIEDAREVVKYANIGNQVASAIIQGNPLAAFGALTGLFGGGDVAGERHRQLLQQFEIVNQKLDRILENQAKIYRKTLEIERRVVELTNLVIQQHAEVMNRLGRMDYKLNIIVELLVKQVYQDHFRHLDTLPILTSQSIDEANEWLFRVGGADLFRESWRELNDLQGVIHPEVRPYSFERHPILVYDVRGALGSGQGGSLGAQERVLTEVLEVYQPTLQLAQGYSGRIPAMASALSDGSGSLKRLTSLASATSLPQGEQPVNLGQLDRLLNGSLVARLALRAVDLFDYDPLFDRELERLVISSATLGGRRVTVDPEEIRLRLVHLEWLLSVAIATHSLMGGDVLLPRLAEDFENGAMSDLAKQVIKENDLLAENLALLIVWRRLMRPGRMDSDARRLDVERWMKYVAGVGLPDISAEQRTRGYVVPKLLADSLNGGYDFELSLVFDEASEAWAVRIGDRAIPLPPAELVASGFIQQRSEVAALQEARRIVRQRLITEELARSASPDDRETMLMLHMSTPINGATP